MISVEEAHEVTVELASAFQRLIPQLSKSSPPPSADDLAEIIADPGNTLFVAVDDSGVVVGTLTLATFRIPTGTRAWIEDVVVDEAAAGQRAGEALTKAALDKARELGCKTVDLTSRPSREKANHIYKKLGFELRETNLYRFDL